MNMNKYNVKENLLAGVIIGAVTTGMAVITNKLLGLYDEDKNLVDEKALQLDKLRKEKDTLIFKNDYGC